MAHWTQVSDRCPLGYLLNFRPALKNCWFAVYRATHHFALNSIIFFLPFLRKKFFLLLFITVLPRNSVFFLDRKQKKMFSYLPTQPEHSRWVNSKPTIFKVGLTYSYCDWKTGIHIWAALWQNQQTDCVHSEDSDQPGHPPSLIRVLAVRIKKPWVLSYPLSATEDSDQTDAQGDLSLHWAHISFCWFCHEAAHIFIMDRKTGIDISPTMSLVLIQMNEIWVFTVQSTIP